MKKLLFLAPLLGAAALLLSQPEPVIKVGPLAGGRGFLLNSGWLLRPAGRQIELDTYPMSSVLTPDGRYLIVLQGGYNPPSITVLDAKSERAISTVRVPDAWLGMALTPNGRLLYVSGGSRAEVYEISLWQRALTTAYATRRLDPALSAGRWEFVGKRAPDPVRQRYLGKSVAEYFKRGAQNPIAYLNVPS